MNVQGKKVLVVGLGKSGISASKLLLQKGAITNITEQGNTAELKTIARGLTELGADVELGKHSEGFIKGTELVVVSPGVPNDSWIIQYLKKNKMPIISEIELAGRYLSCPIVGVTGTNGKSTVTSLIDHIFRYSGKHSIACGNIGFPLSEVVMSKKKYDIAVVEISSFQLEYTYKLHSHIAVFLNFSYDHQDYHTSMQKYWDAKFKLFYNQSGDDWAVINYDKLFAHESINDIKSKKIFFGGDPRLKEYVQNVLWIEDNNMKIKINGETDVIQGVKDILGFGVHQMENLLAAVAVAKICGIHPFLIKEAVERFKPLPFRMQKIAAANDIDFINDSKSTNISSVIAALSGVPGEVVLIMGGKDKGDNFSQLASYIEGKVSCLIAIGEAAERIKKELSSSVLIEKADSLKKAIEIAFNKADYNKTVLFSPGCSSFDMFKDYKERGRAFNILVGECTNKKQLTQEMICS